MPRSPRRHWRRLPSREETLKKYPPEKLCNDMFEQGQSIYICQILKEHSHSWHIEKGRNGIKGFTMAWKDVKAVGSG